MSKSTTHTQATVDENVGPNEIKTLGPKNFDKQAIRGLPILPRWLLKRLHLA